MTVAIISILAPVSAFASEMGFYENETYDFYLEAPTDWNYQESLAVPLTESETMVLELVLFPSEFHISNADGDGDLVDMQTALLGWEFQFDSPTIIVDFVNVPTSEVKILNESNLREYYLDLTRELLPDARISDCHSNTHSWGWEVGCTAITNLSLGFGSQPFVYKSVSTAFFFKDREMYDVGYAAPEQYFDHYEPIYDHVVDTLVIKSVKVPEFGSVVMWILAGSVLLFIVTSRNIPRIVK